MYWGFDFIQFLEAGEMLFFTLKSTFKKTIMKQTINKSFAISLLLVLLSLFLSAVLQLKNTKRKTLYSKVKFKEETA